MVRPAQPYPERILNKFLLDESGCWLWAAGSQFGYGITHLKENGRWKQKKAHRVFYELFVGSIPEGLTIDHLCRTTLCVNPDHLEPVTQAANNRRAPTWFGNRTHCIHGHEFTPENTYPHPYRPNIRDCRECRRDASRRRVAQISQERRATK